MITDSANVLMATLSGTDIDAGDVLTYTIVDSTASGTLVLTGNIFSYDPIVDFV